MSHLAAMRRLAEPEAKKTLFERAQAVLEAREIAAKVAATLQAIEDEFLAAARPQIPQGENSLTMTVNGKKVIALTGVTRREGNVEALRATVDEDTFQAATEPKISWKGYDALRLLGKITNEQHAAIVKDNPVKDTVRVV